MIKIKKKKKKYNIFSVEWWILLLLLLYYAQHTIIWDRPSWLFGSFLFCYLYFFLYFILSTTITTAQPPFSFSFFTAYRRYLDGLSLSISTLISFPLPYIYFSRFYFIFFFCFFEFWIFFIYYYHLVNIADGFVATSQQLCVEIR